MNSAIETEFLSRIAKKYKLDIIKLTSLWEKKPDIIVVSQKYSLSENDLNDIYNQVENEMKDYDEFNDDIVFESQLTFSESQHMSKDDEISLTKFGLVDIPLDNIYNMRKLKLLEGESKFFLRQLINSYRFLKYHEKLNITSLDFYKIYNNLNLITFPSKKSPLGLLLGIYIYDEKHIVDMDRFYKITKVKKGGNIDATLIIPISYIYKVYASDVVRYAKLFHSILS